MSSLHRPRIVNMTEHGSVVLLSFVPLFSLAFFPHSFALLVCGLTLCIIWILHDGFLELGGFDQDQLGKKEVGSLQVEDINLNLKSTVKSYQTSTTLEPKLASPPAESLLNPQEPLDNSQAKPPLIQEPTNPSEVHPVTLKNAKSSRILSTSLGRGIFTLIKEAFIVYETQADTKLFRRTPPEPLENCPAIEEMKLEAEYLFVEMHSYAETELPFPMERRISCVCHGNELEVAIATRDLWIVEAALRCGCFDVNKTSALSVAVQRGSADLLELLLLYGARINGIFAFSEACDNGHSKVLATLLRYPLPVHETPDCLRKACYNGRVLIVASLLRWRSIGRPYHLASLPLAGCVQSTLRKLFGDSITNICEFLETPRDPCRRYQEHDYMRTCIIIEMLIQTGVQHKDECDCGRTGWKARHRILEWRREFQEKVEKSAFANLPEHKLLKPRAVEKEAHSAPAISSNGSYCSTGTGTGSISYGASSFPSHVSKHLDQSQIYTPPPSPYSKVSFTRPITPSKTPSIFTGQA